MNQIRKLATLTVLAILAGAACATAPLVDYKDQPFVTSSGRPPTLEEVRRAVITTATAQGWTLEPAGDQAFVAKTLIKGKYSASVDLAYTAEKLTLTYKDSVGLGYWVKPEGGAVINKNYNIAIRSLADKIRAEIAKL